MLGGETDRMLGNLLDEVAAFAYRQRGAFSLRQVTKVGVTERHVRAWLRWERRPLETAISPFSGNIRLGSEKEAVALRRFKEWGVPPPVCQYKIRDGNGRFLARVDFAWPERRFGLEYLGDEPHAPR